MSYEVAAMISNRHEKVSSYVLVTTSCRLGTLRHFSHSFSARRCDMIRCSPTQKMFRGRNDAAPCVHSHRVSTERIRKVLLR